MEIFTLHPITKKWIEIGNSGVFRPELLLLYLKKSLKLNLFTNGNKNHNCILNNIEFINNQDSLIKNPYSYFYNK